jgi:hypothetical protein
MTAQLLIADSNEFHPVTDGRAYSAWSPVIIMRAHNGFREDYSYAQSRAQVEQAGVKFVGHYGYCVAGVDAAQQGRDFAAIVNRRGGYHPGHTIYCDLEEGGADQSVRLEAWLAAAGQALNVPAAAEGGYSGEDFWKAHLGQVPSGRHRWIAGYGQADPQMGEQLWQFTDAESVPGIVGPCDCSIFAGDLAAYQASIGYTPPAPPAPPVPPIPKERTMKAVMTTPTTEYIVLDDESVVNIKAPGTGSYLTKPVAEGGLGLPIWGPIDDGTAAGFRPATA